MGNFSRCADAFKHGKLRELKLFEYSTAYMSAMNSINAYANELENEAVKTAIQIAQEHSASVSLLAKKDTRDALTEQINEAHTDRVDELRGFYTAVQAFSYMKNEKRSNNGKYLARLLKKSGLNDAMKNQKQMTGFLIFIESLAESDEHFMSAIIALGLEESLADLISAQTRYTDLTFSKPVVFSNNGNASIDTTEIRRRAQECLTYVFMAIDVDIFTTKTVAYQKLLVALQKSIEPFILLLTRRDNAKVASESENSASKGSSGSTGNNTSNGGGTSNKGANAENNDDSKNEYDASGDNQNESMGSGDDNTNNNDGELGDGVMTASSMPINEPVPLENGGSTENHNMSEPATNGYEGVGNSVGF